MMMTDRTREELADALGVMEARLTHVFGDDNQILREAARRLREQDGERIEGIVVEETRGMDGTHRIVIEQRDRDMADPVGYARATLIIHTQEPESR